MSTILKVKVKERGTWETKYVSVEDCLYDEALKEKKKTISANDYRVKFERGLMYKYNELMWTIQQKLKNSMVDICIERINIED